MFGRSNWAIFGLETDSAVFQSSLDSGNIKEFLQSTVLSETKGTETESISINPFSAPRLDEEEDTPPSLDFSLGNGCYAFWLVLNGQKDVTDPASKKEGLSYRHMGRPFRFLAKKEKEIIEEQVNSSAVTSRQQFPVLLDFQHGRAYIENTSKVEILAVRELLEGLGVKTFSLCWSFGEAEWPSKFLNAINKDTRFASEMRSRAEELAKLRPDQVDKLEDKEMEKIVSSFFAFTPLGNSLVACLGCPSLVCIHPVSDPVGVSSPSVAFSLLGMTQDSEVAGASLTLMEPVAKKVKGAGEKTVNKPVLSVDINDNISNFDAGAALLRGFDMPQFKRHVKTALKAQGGLEIRDFWAIWLTDMHDAILAISDSIADALGLGDGTVRFGLVEFDSEGDSTEIEVKEDSGVVRVEQLNLDPHILNEAKDTGEERAFLVDALTEAAGSATDEDIPDAEIVEEDKE